MGRESVYEQRGRAEEVALLSVHHHGPVAHDSACHRVSEPASRGQTEVRAGAAVTRQPAGISGQLAEKRRPVGPGGYRPSSAYTDCDVYTVHTTQQLAEGFQLLTMRETFHIQTNFTKMICPFVTSVTVMYSRMTKHTSILAWSALVRPSLPPRAALIISDQIRGSHLIPPLLRAPTVCRNC